MQPLGAVAAAPRGRGLGDVLWQYPRGRETWGAAARGVVRPFGVPGPGEGKTTGAHWSPVNEG